MSRSVSSTTTEVVFAVYISDPTHGFMPSTTFRTCEDRSSALAACHKKVYTRENARESCRPVNLS